MDTEMIEEPQSPEADPGEPGVNPEPRITNRAQGGIRSDKTRFIRPVERQRMRPWLIDHLDQNDIPGLVWQERAEKIFRISWKHAANQCFNMQKDTNLFERWAIHTGRHQDSDHKRWKANFRCALNSLPDVTEMKEQGVKKGNNAFKVYRFLDEKEAKMGKDGKPRKKKEPPDYKEENALMKIREGYASFSSEEGMSSGASGATGSSLPNLHQLVPTVSGVDLLLEADSKEKLQPIVGGMDNLQEILAAATASLAAGGDALALEKISIEQLSRLGEVSKMKLDIRQSDRKRRKKEVSGILNVFLCNWCEKVFPTKVDLFQHFLIIHQDKLLSGEEYGARKHTLPSEKLQQEIEDLEKKVLGFTQETYQIESEEVIEDGQVVDLSSNNSMTSQEIYIEDQVLDLSVAGALAKHPQPQSDVALDLSMSTSKHKTGQKTAAPKLVQKRRRSNASDVDYTNKFGNYGLAGAPRTKRQMSLLLKRKEEEEEKARKHAEAQHSMEDIVHAEILISLKSGSKEENETEGMEVENGVENVNKPEDGSVVETDTMNDQNLKNEPTKQGSSETDSSSESEAKKVQQKMDEVEEIEEEPVSFENVIYLELNDGSKVAVSKRVETPPPEIEKADKEEINKKDLPVFVDSIEKAETVTVTEHNQNGSLGKPYKCALCPQRFEDPTELLTHVSVHKTEYKCSVCTKVMTDKDVYLRHVESHLPDGKHSQICEVCNVHFSTVEELQKHIKSHEYGTKVYKCGRCGKAYQTINECTNCEICHQIKVKDASEDRQSTHKVSDKTAITTKTGEEVNEKGAASASVVGGNEFSAEKSDDINKNIKNTGQKNLRGEPAVNPAAGSGNLTGIRNVEGGDLSRKCSTQESFELPMDCLQDTENEVQHIDVRNDVVDGENKERIHGEKVKDSAGIVKEKVIGQSSSFQKIPKSLSDSGVYAIIRVDKESVRNDAAKNKTETCVSGKHFEKQISFRIYNCLQCSATFGNEVDLNNHKQTHKETIEDQIKKNVFHCGICNVKLYLNNVEAHLQTHKSCQIEKKNDLKFKDKCTCIICNEAVPVKKFYTHLKSHSVYDLSQAQNLMLAQRSMEETAESDKDRKPFICKLCRLKFEKFSDLKLHVTTHLGPRIYHVQDAKSEVCEQKPAVLAKSKQSSEDIPVRGKKRKDVDEKRITGKRQKKKAKGKSKPTKLKQETDKEKVTKADNTDVKTGTSSAIAAALKTGPMYKINVLANQKSVVSGKDLETKVQSEEPPESKGISDSSAAKVIRLDSGLLVLKHGEVLMRGEGDIEGLNVKRRKLEKQTDFDSQKKLKYTSECLSDVQEPHENKKDCSADESERSYVTDNPQTSIAELKSSDAYIQTHQQAIVIKQESSDTGNVELTEKTSGASLMDTSCSGANVLPATLQKLQQKISWVKEGPVKVGTPLFSPIPVTSIASQKEFLAGRPVLGKTNTISTVPLSELKSLMKTSVVPSSADHADTIKELTKKQKTPLINIVKDLCQKTPAASTDKSVTNLTAVNIPANSKASLIQLGNEDRVQLTSADVPLTMCGMSLPSAGSALIQSSTDIPLVSTPLLPSVVPLTSILNLSSTLPMKPVSQLPRAVLNVSQIKPSEVDLARYIQQLQSSVTNVPLLSSATAGSLQSISQVFPGTVSNIPVTSLVSQGSLIMSVSSANTTANATSQSLPKLNLLQQQQDQLNMLKSMLEKVNQPSVVYKPAVASVMIPQGGLQQTVSGVAQLPSSNTAYVSRAVPTLQANDISKPSAFQLVWLPVNQTVSSESNKACVDVSPSLNVTGSLPTSQSDRTLPLHSTVLGAKLGYNVVQTQSQISTGLVSSKPSSGTIFTMSSISPSSNQVTLTSGRAFCAVTSSKEKDPPVFKVSSLPAAQRSKDIKLASDVTAYSDVKESATTSNTSSALKLSSGLCLACSVCKQALSSLEQMSSHVCKLSAVSPAGQRMMSLTRLKQPGQLTSTPTNSIAFQGATSLANMADTVNKPALINIPGSVNQPTEVRMLPTSDSLNRISISQGIPATSHSTLVSLDLLNTATSTIPVASESSSSVATADITADPELCSHGFGTATSVKGLTLPPADEISQTENKMDTLAHEAESAPQRTDASPYIYFLPTKSTETTTVSTDTVVSSTAHMNITKTTVTKIMNSASSSGIEASTVDEGSDDSVAELTALTKVNEDKSSGSFSTQDPTSQYGSKKNSTTDIRTTDIGGSTIPHVVKEPEHVITLYPCVICKKTITFDQFRKHALKHMSEENVTDKEKKFICGIPDDPTKEAKHTSKEGEGKHVGKKVKSSRQCDIYRCCLCFKTCENEISLSKHYESLHQGMAGHLCPAADCAQIFFEMHEVDMHFALKHQHECRFCLHRFRTYVEFQAHIVQHYNNRTLKYLVCVKCKLHFASAKSFNSHCKGTVSRKCQGLYLDKLIECQQCQCCSVNFTSNGCMKLHFKRKWYQRVAYRCCICREAISAEADFLNHMTRHFPASDENKVCFCHTCCIMFPYRSVLTHHSSSQEHIDAETSRRRLLDKHKLQQEESENVESSKSVEMIGNEKSKFAKGELETDDKERETGFSKDLYTCERCNTCYKTSFDLKQHKVFRHSKGKLEPKKSTAKSGGACTYSKMRESRIIVCEYCSRRYFNVDQLRQHIDISHDKKLYFACKNPDCVMNFNSFYESETHVCKSLSKGPDITENSCTLVDACQPSLKSIKEYMLQYYVEDCKQLLDKIASTVENVQEHLGDHFLCQYCKKRFGYCEILKFHLVRQHADKLAQCVDCLEYFFHQNTLLEHRRECAVKGFSDEDFHTKKKFLGCDVCFNSFIYILGLTKYLRDIKFISEKNKSSGFRCVSRKGVFDLKFDGESGQEKNSSLPYTNPRKFVCINCKNEYCNAEDFYICMKSRLTAERNKLNDESSYLVDSQTDEIKEETSGQGDVKSTSLFAKSHIDLQNVFFCNDCEAIVCYTNDEICAASLKHPCSSSNTIIIT